ncbi:MAG: amidohydrolase family protein [Clostridia bacterium]|nr:amidohydrolase family protein [Clostridia bacterium]
MIIDTHVHIGNAIGKCMTKEMVIESMERYEIDFSLVSNLSSVEYDGDLNPIPMILQKSQLASFEESIDFARRHPDMIGILPWIKPATERPDEDFWRLMEENSDIVYGIKVHPFHSKTYFDSPKMESYIQLAQKFHIPVFSHTGGCEEAHPIHVYNMAVKYPDVNFVMVHMGLGTDNQEAIELLGKAPNLYADTTWVPISSIIEIVKNFGSDRVFFGSDNPIDGVDTYHHNPKGELSVYQQYFNELERKIGSEHYQNIMYKNAMNVLGVKIKNRESLL